MRQNESLVGKQGQPENRIENRWLEAGIRGNGLWPQHHLATGINIAQLLLEEEDLEAAIETMLDQSLTQSQIEHFAEELNKYHDAYQIPLKADPLVVVSTTVMKPIAGSQTLAALGQTYKNSTLLALVYCWNVIAPSSERAQLPPNAYSIPTTSRIQSLLTPLLRQLQGNRKLEYLSQLRTIVNVVMEALATPKGIELARQYREAFRGGNKYGDARAFQDACTREMLADIRRHVVSRMKEQGVEVSPSADFLILLTNLIS